MNDWQGRSLALPWVDRQCKARPWPGRSRAWKMANAACGTEKTGGRLASGSMSQWPQDLPDVVLVVAGACGRPLILVGVGRFDAPTYFFSLRASATGDCEVGTLNNAKSVPGRPPSRSARLIQSESVLNEGVRMAGPMRTWPLWCLGEVPAAQRIGAISTLTSNFDTPGPARDGLLPLRMPRLTD